VPLELKDVAVSVNEPKESVPAVCVYVPDVVKFVSNVKFPVGFVIETGIDTVVPPVFLNVFA
jgi:hypothetical protein